jgi:hypothetical protein
MPDLGDQIDKLQGDRTKLIDAIIATMETKLGQAQRALWDSLVADFVDKLDVDEDGNVKNTLANKQKFNRLDRIFDAFNATTGLEIAAVIVKQVDKIFSFNNKYFGNLTTPTVMGKIFPDTEKQINDWLGITQRGGLVENGYLQRIIQDPTVRNNVRDTMFQAIVTKQGYQRVKSDLKDYILGLDADQAGALKKYYRNFVYDTFSQVDRTQAKIIADKLVLKYAIYEGGLIKTSREFCKKRNGKVFTTEEIEKFDPTVAKPPNYNPFTDLGGYGCRHHLNYIPESLAFILRPDLKPAA